jgi:hypothetical protein
MGEVNQAAERGLTDTISANVLITAMTMSPATTKEMTHPADPDIPMSCPEVTNNSIPIVPLNAIAVTGSVSERKGNDQFS